MIFKAIKNIYACKVILFFAAIAHVVVLLPVTASSQTPVPPVLSVDHQGSHPVSLKINFLPLAAVVPAVGVEIKTNPRWSVNVPVMYSPYFISRNKGIRILASQPELRRWLRHSGTGHFLGVHLSVAIYNIRMDKYRYQDVEMPAVGAGLSYGYVMRLNDRFYSEFAIGAGYFHTKYKRYLNKINDRYVDTRTTSYFGIDSASISLIYNI